MPLPSRTAAPTRRAILAAIALASASTSTRSAEAVDRLGVPGPLRFGDTGYLLAWSSHPTATYYKQEYLPAGETSDSYARMLIIELVDAGASVESALAAQIRTLNQRKGRDPIAKFEVLQNRQTGEALLDFLVSDRNAKGVEIAEWNAYRYVPRRNAAGGTGVMLFAISHRAYGDAAIRDFLIRLKTFRPAEINRIAQQASPVVRTAK